jgi:hypothetical protein
MFNNVFATISQTFKHFLRFLRIKRGENNSFFRTAYTFRTYLVLVGVNIKKTGKLLRGHTYLSQKNKCHNYFIGYRRPILNFAPRGEVVPQEWILSPRGEVIPWGWNSVCPSILLNSIVWSPLGVNDGVNIPPRGQSSPLGANHDVKTWPRARKKVTNVIENN